MENNVANKIFNRRYIATIAAAAIVSGGLVQGLNLVGNGLSAKSGNSITVTGQAKTSAVADNVSWTLYVQESSPNVGTAVKKVEASVIKLQEYLTKGGIPTDGIEVWGVNPQAMAEYINGNPTGRMLSYQASRNVVVRSKDVALVKTLSTNLGSLLQTGVNVNNYGPQYYVSNLAALRPQLLAEATKDAKVRGEAITKAVGSKLGPVIAVSGGPVQVTAPDSVDTSAGGMYDTTSIPKTVTVTVSVSFKVK